jgi:hypothetical protein
MAELFSVALAVKTAFWSVFSNNYRTLSFVIPAFSPAIAVVFPEMCVV